MMAVITVGETRAKLHRLIDHAAESRQPIVIAGKRSSAVLVSELLSWEPKEKIIRVLRMWTQHE
jgi:antitoxin YefM